MGKIWAVAALLISIVLFTVRFKRCSQRMNENSLRQGEQQYAQECQKYLDSAAVFFNPIAAKASAGSMVDETTLQKATERLYDLAADTRTIKPFNDPEGYIKTYISGFIEHQRSLTCCYLKKYQEEISKGKPIQKGTAHNLLQWIIKYQEYSSYYQSTRFNLHRDYQLNNIKDKLTQAASGN